MKYFTNCKTIEDVKKTYKELAKKFHPDCGGNAELFKEMSAEYEIAFNMYKDIHMNAEGETYHKETTGTAQQFADIINKIIYCSGLNIEIIGSWIWLTGNTYMYRETIKAAGFFWSKNKQAWYYNGDTKKSTYRGKYNMTQLREMWGSTTIDTESQAQLA